MRFLLRTKVILIGLLILLAVVFRYPTTPHEIGWDSFGVHLMTNSISEFGYARWWIHPTSIIGIYPYSGTPSAVPFFISGISQCIGMDVELVILLYSMFLGLFSIFAAYLMAGAIWNNYIFKFLTAFVFSTSQGILTITTWTANARTLFIIILPLFIYMLLRTRVFKVRFCILTLFILLLLLVTHHYIYFTVPIMLSYFIVIIVYKVGKHFKSVKIPENLVNFSIFTGLVIMFSVPFFVRSLMETDTQMMKVVGNQYVLWILYILQSYTRYIGVLIVLSVSGYSYLLLKRNKKFGEWFLLLCLAGVAPLVYTVTYMKWFVLSFTSLLIGVAITNVATIGMQEKTHIAKRKYATTFVVILLLFSIIFTGYYQYLHFLNDPDLHTRYMEDKTYNGALWMKDAIDKDENMIVVSFFSHRVFSISEVPTLTGIGAADLAYGFVDPNKFEVIQIHSPFSTAFYLHDPYKVVNHSNTVWHAREIPRGDINDYSSWTYRSIHRFNISYCVENKDFQNPFTRSVQLTKNNLYDNGNIRVWRL